MSLVEGLLLDNLLQNSVASEVHIALREDLKDNPARFGAGTAQDPFDGSQTTSGVCKFDLILGNVAANSCVRLGPGVFPTKGTAGYSIPNGVRIAGSGRDVTTVRVDANGAYAFGTSASGAPSIIQTQGIEICDLCIDCAGKGSAIYITGENNTFRNLRITKFGPDPTQAIGRVIVQIADSVPGMIARNCVLDGCIFDNAGTYVAGSSVVLVKLAGASLSAPHQFCTVRRCVFNGEPASPPGSPPVVYPVTAIDPGLGRGFIAEENYMIRVETGVKLSYAAAIDLIFWNNEFNVVKFAFDMAHNGTGSNTVGRVVVIENAINLARIDGVDCMGIRFIGVSNQQNFNQVILRKNLIAADPGTLGPTADLWGIVLKSCAEAIVENNIINDCDAVPYTYADCTNFKSFNNQKKDGTLLHAYDSINSRFLMELQDFTEDALIGF